MPPEQEQAIKLYLQGTPITQICTLLGLKRSTVSRWLLIHCPDSRSKHKADTIEHIKAIGLNPQLSLSANAKMLNTDINTIRAVAHDLEIDEATFSRPQPNKKDQEVLEMRLSGLSYRTIGAKLNISHERVRQLLQRCGYKNPPKPPKPPRSPKIFTILKTPP